MIWNSNSWSKSSGEEELEQEVESQEVEEVEFCWLRCSKLTILVALRSIFLLADLYIAAEILRTQCFIIAWTFDFLTSKSTNSNCNLSQIIHPFERVHNLLESTSYLFITTIYYLLKHLTIVLISDTVIQYSLVLYLYPQNQNQYQKYTFFF